MVDRLSDRVAVGGLQVASVLHAFVRDEALPGSGVDEAAFWAGVEAILGDFTPRNRELLARRDELQQHLDEWHEKNPGPVGDQAAYVQLLRDLGYLVDEPDDFSIETENVDDEVAVQAGPQLVVPVLNARFAANAANRALSIGTTSWGPAWVATSSSTPLVSIVKSSGSSTR